MLNISDYQIFLAAIGIYNLVYKYADYSRRPWIKIEKNPAVNPFFNQTKQGLFLEMYRGEPSSIHTPWGRLTCLGNRPSGWNEACNKLLDELGVVAQIRLMEAHSQIHAIREVCGDKLPVPEYKNITKYESYSWCDNTWKDFLKNYYHQGGAVVCLAQDVERGDYASIL
ncbi:MAG: hypothetical protein Q8K92_08815 [Leadbetterella sp.]|nr:hypothetical protein [Leadbetterella sp.]